MDVGKVVLMAVLLADELGDELVVKRASLTADKKAFCVVGTKENRLVGRMELS